MKWWATVLLLSSCYMYFKCLIWGVILNLHSRKAFNQDLCSCARVSVWERVHQRERERQKDKRLKLDPIVTCLWTTGETDRLSQNVCLLKLPFCPSTHQPRMACTQPELNLRTTSALLTMLSTCIFLTDCENAKTHIKLSERLSS